MESGSPSSGGFRKHFKHMKEVLRTGFQPSAPRTPSPNPRPQPHPPTETPPPDTIPSPEQPIQPPAQPQRPATPPQPVLSAKPPLSTNSSTTANSAQPVDIEPGRAQAVKIAWAGLKVALELVKESSDVFPPLKSAVAGFLGVVHIFEAAAQSREDYVKLASHLQAMVDDFAKHPGEQTSSNMLDALNAMASGLEEEMAHVQKKQQRSGFRRYLGVGQDPNDVQECYDRVEKLRHVLQDKAMMRLWKIGEEQQVEARLDKLNAALKAMYNSSMSTVIGRRKCTPGTREAILTGMRKWADNPHSPNVYWLNGMAGTGKTTLAYSFCAEMQLAGRLGGSFFCSRADAESRDVSRIVPTIAYQLARLVPSYCKVLVRQIGEDKNIGARQTETQFEKLIRDPLLEVRASVPKGMVITIDALDECDRRDSAQDILNVLLLNARHLPVRFLVTCRPEPGLFDMLQSESEHHRSVLHLHEIESSFVQADIRTYLKDELDDMSLSGENLGQLAEQAGTLFIYAATAVRYIRPKGRRVDFTRRLEQFLSMTSEKKTKKHKGIDDLYTAVLAAPFADEELGSGEKENIRLVLDTVICAREPMSVTTMAKLLGIDSGDDVTDALQHLRSVLHISQDGGLISTLHASFPDFMFDRERSKDLCCDAASHHQLLSLRCFNIMRRSLRFNICELESSFALDEEISGLAERVKEVISPELFYACRYWGDHLVSTKALDHICSTLHEFLSHQLLFWMEVLNLKNCIGAGAQMLIQAHAWLPKLGRTNDVLELALDAGRFVTAFGMSQASRSTPHIYISALPFWPKTRPVRQQYWKHTQGLVNLEGTAMERRDLSCLTAWNVASSVPCVAFSPDNTRIVSGSSDYAIRVWDARSGILVAGPFKGHTGWVLSVAFSADSTRIVSSSRDKTIRVWDARSGLLLAGPFEGHTDVVNSVAFSPDCTRIASGSKDQTIRVWDARSGALVAGPFEGHTDSVSSVGFSPDGTRIISGSHDKTIGVWDARTGAPVAGPFRGHTNRVMSVKFSLDGARIVSGSADKTVRVWDAYSGDLVAGPFEGHSDSVLSVEFSPDGTCIVSGSFDDTIRLWDARNGLLLAVPFEGHSRRVYSVGFSPDGTRIVSGSHDQTIRVWGARSADFVAGPFEGHADLVLSVCFSPEGTRIASGSDDGAIRVWDAHSGALLVGPFRKNTSAVNSVGFSPDGTHIVSGSNDNAIRVWDAHSGALLAMLFEGHTAPVNSVAFSLDGAHIVSGSHDKTIRVWDARNGLLVAGPFEGHTDEVSSVGFSSDSTHIASGSDDKTICVWDACSGALVAGPFEGHTGSVNSVQFSPNSAYIASGSSDKTIRVWDVQSGALAAGPFEGHTMRVNSVAFSSDSTLIASGSNDKTIRVWDARSGIPVAGPFQGHIDLVSSVGFSPDDTRIVSGSWDNSIRIWDAVPVHIHDSVDLADWVMDQRGVVTTQQGQLLLCVPVDLWIVLARPHNPICIYWKGILRLNFDRALLGGDWVGCYQCRRSAD